jgi:4-hydroxybenzoyl-CoA thioesterase
VSTAMSSQRQRAAETVTSIQIEPGHSDPQGVVEPAHFFAWFTACTHLLLGHLGLDPATLQVRYTQITTPLVDARARFLGPVSVGDRLDVHSRVTEIGESRFAITHRFFRGTMPICEGHELRLWATLHPDDPQRHLPVPLPAAVVCALMGRDGDHVA